MSDDGTGGRLFLVPTPIGDLEEARCISMRDHNGRYADLRFGNTYL